jgi:hypothetical protein
VVGASMKGRPIKSGDPTKNGNRDMNPPNACVSTPR